MIDATITIVNIINIPDIELYPSGCSAYGRGEMATSMSLPTILLIFSKYFGNASALKYSGRIWTSRALST